MIRFLTLIFLIGIVQGIPDLPISPCEYKDTLCMIEAQNRHYQTFIHAYHLDPVNTSTFNVTSPGLGLTFFNPEAIGLEGCSVSAVSLDVKNGKLNHTVACPWILVRGAYEGKGLLLGIRPIDGEGPFYIILYDFTISYEVDITIYKGPNKKDYMSIKRINRLEYDPRGEIVLSLKNLVGGNIQESKAAQKFLDENARPAVLAYQKTVIDNFMTIVLARLDNYFSKVPMIDIFSGPQHNW